MSSSELKNIILNLNEPVIFKNKLDWSVLKWNLDDWKRVLKNENLVFRTGKKSFTKEPQWEQSTTEENITFEEFLTLASSSSSSWFYFDYKYLKEWLHDVEELRNVAAIDWSCFGFPEYTFKDSTMWIGSSGAHTSCHADTYGCNLVAQVYGRKQWLLLPPQEDLNPTRIPYEESSIYSKLNFFSPTVGDFKEIKSCRKIVLEPGDVLLVPKKWWHYVENLDVAISVNVWLPQVSDDESRLEEALVQFLISQTVKNMSNACKKSILNPNSQQELQNMDVDSSLGLVSVCKNLYVKSCKENRESNFKMNSTEWVKSCNFLHTISIMPSDDFLIFLQEQRARFTTEEAFAINSDFSETHETINAFIHPDVISLYSPDITNRQKVVRYNR